MTPVARFNREDAKLKRRKTLEPQEGRRSTRIKKDKALNPAMFAFFDLCLSAYLFGFFGSLGYRRRHD